MLVQQQFSLISYVRGKSLLSIITTVFRPTTLDELASCFDLPGEVEDDIPEIIGLWALF
jgi:hypothetical protein